MKTSRAFHTSLIMFVVTAGAVSLFAQARQSPNKERGITALLRALAELNSIAPEARDRSLEEISTLIRQSLSDAQTNLGYTYPPPNAPPVRSAVPVAGRFLGLDNTATQLKYAVSQFRAANPGTNPESLSSSIAKAEQALTMVASAQAAKDANINDGRAHNVGDLQGPFQGNVSYVKRAGDIQIQLSMIVANLGQRADPSTLPRTEEWNVSLLMNDGTVLEQLSRSPIPPARPPGVGNAGTSYAMMHFFFKLPNSGNPAAVVVKFKDQTQRISLKSN